MRILNLTVILNFIAVYPFMQLRDIFFIIIGRQTLFRQTLFRQSTDDMIRVLGNLGIGLGIRLGIGLVVGLG